MSALIAALVMFALGEFLKRQITRKWSRLYLRPKSAIFPRICPMCLSPNADSTVDEKSPERQTAYYVVAQKLEWWKAAVPHCSKCAVRQSRNHVVGLVLGGVCALAALFLDPPTEASLVTFCYILFGYPAYVVVATIQKGIVFGRASSTIMCVHIKHPQYLTKLAALNPLP